MQRPVLYVRSTRQSQGKQYDFKLLFEDFPERIIPYDYDAYFSNPDRFVMVTTDCLTGKAEYLEEKASSARVMDIVRASSSLPFVSPITYVDGVPMLDGGIADSIPVEYAMSQGYEKLVVVLTRNKGYRKKETRMPAAKVFYRGYPNLQKALSERNAVYNRTMDLIERLEDEGRIRVVGPADAVDRLAARLGNSHEHLDHPNILTIFIGIFMGILFGSLPIVIPA